MRLSLTIGGVKENAQAVRALKERLMEELYAESRAVSPLLADSLREYPAERPGSDYVRTYSYQQSINVQTTYRTGAIDITARASEVQHWLRGDLDGGYPGAWMHVGRWQSMVNIVSAFMVKLQAALNRRIERLIGELFGT
jgi:hypothetical protein